MTTADSGNVDGFSSRADWFRLGYTQAVSDMERYPRNCDMTMMAWLMAHVRLRCPDPLPDVTPDTPLGITHTDDR